MTAETVFRAMGDETRLRMLRVLHGHELNVSELVEILAQPQSTVSRHLKVLREAGLIQDQRQGTTVHYSLRSEANGSDLPQLVLGWAGEQPMPRAILHRRDGVLRRRREMSDRFFETVGRQWDEMREEAFGASFHLEAMLSLLPSEWSVADIGTGTGYLLPALARHFRTIVAVEPVARMLETARHRADAAGLTNVELRSGDLAALPMSEAEVDLAVALLVLHHVPAPREALAELYRVVKPGGHVLIVEQQAHENAAFHERMQDRWWGFSTEEFAGWVRSAGFTRVSARDLTPTDKPQDSPGLFVVTAAR